MTEGFRAGERYRLGLGLVRDEWQRDDWTGTTVRLVMRRVPGGPGPRVDPFWWCVQFGPDGAELDERLTVSEARLRAAAFLGGNDDDDDGDG